MLLRPRAVPSGSGGAWKFADVKIIATYTSKSNEDHLLISIKKGYIFTRNRNITIT